MFQNILVPVDFSERTPRALEIAVGMAQLNGGKVTLLHVIELLVSATFEEFEDFYRTLEQNAEAKMRDLLARNTDGVTVESHIVYGDRMQEIVKFAEEQEVDLIVMNSHRIDPQNPTQGWGTISYKVSVLAQCPVMLVK